MGTSHRMVNVTRRKLMTDPSVSIYEVEIRSADSGVWRETITTEEGLELFIRGVRAGAAMCGNRHALVENAVIETGPPILVPE